MKPHDEPNTAAEAEQIQRELAARVEIPAIPVPEPQTVAGLDVSYETGTDRIVAAAVVFDTVSGAQVEEVLVAGRVEFPYTPGLLAFREVPILLEALRRLHSPVDLLVCDGQGLAHPRRCGVACHLGVLTGIRAVGCAKNHYVGEFRAPGPARGDRSPLVHEGELLGEVLRTQDGVRPVFVSPGHRVGITQATEIVLSLCSSYRLPDAIRRADHISRQALRQNRSIEDLQVRRREGGLDSCGHTVDGPVR